MDVGQYICDQRYQIQRPVNGNPVAEFSLLSTKSENQKIFIPELIQNMDTFKADTILLEWGLKEQLAITSYIRGVKWKLVYAISGYLT